MAQFEKLDLNSIPTPCFVVDEFAIEQNLKILHQVQRDSGAKILAALKAFSMWSLGGMFNQYLAGTCASGIHEARLGYEEFGGEVHVFSAAFSPEELNDVLKIANHVVFNSVSQWQRYQDICLSHQDIKFGLRINPEHSEGEVPLYDPCAPDSRLGITLEELQSIDNPEQFFAGITGLHFHTLCEQGFAPLSRTLDVFEKKFTHIIKNMAWVNFGGGHHITQPGYDIDGLVTRIKAFSQKHDVQVYLEPGEAIAINSGVLVTEVLDIRGKQNNQLILDTSATCHMPDVLEMPYRPDILFSRAFAQSETCYTYALGGMTCLAGDKLGEYSFEKPIAIGDKLVFLDMSHYTMVKTTTFNGINLPSIAIWNSQTNAFRVVKKFGYEDFKSRLS